MPKFFHPHANQELRLGADTAILVAYVLKRSPRKSIGFVVNAQGLEVSAPARLSLTAVEAALHTKADWILRKLQQVRNTLEQRENAPQPEWCHGMQLPFLGGWVRVVCEANAGEVLRAKIAMPVLRRADGVILDAHKIHDLWMQPIPLELALALPPNASSDLVRQVVQIWQQNFAHNLFLLRMAHFAPLLGVQWRDFSLSNASTRWGSASSSGKILLHWRLLNFPFAVVDYVVVHELAHLRHMNHGPQFWALVASILPDYMALRKALKSSPIM